MNEEQLIELIRKEGDDLSVTPPVVADMVRSGRRTRRNRGVLGIVAAAAVVVVGVGAYVTFGGTDNDSIPTVPGPTNVGPTRVEATDAWQSPTLNTGDWQPEAGHPEKVKGALTVGSNGCVHLRPLGGPSDDGQTVMDVVWPQEFSVGTERIGGESIGTILDARGEQVTRMSVVELRGEFADDASGLACDSTDDPIRGPGEVRVFDVYEWKAGELPKRLRDQVETLGSQ